MHLLIGPLEILSSMEEPLVRDKAVEALIALSEGLNESIYLTFKSRFFWKPFFPNNLIVRIMGQFSIQNICCVFTPSSISTCKLRKKINFMGII